ncbi:hypothetical protein [Kribbella sancticallisti]
MLSVDEVEQSLAVGHELRAFELKGPGSCDSKQFRAKVIRAALGMGNLRDGGHVVIGIDDRDPAAMLPGLSADDLRSWSSHDTVASRFAEYADPPLQFELAKMTLSSGADLVVLAVDQFTDIPHLCAKDYPSDLRKGALYVRARRMRETVEVATAADMRDVIDTPRPRRS